MSLITFARMSLMARSLPVVPPAFVATRTAASTGGPLKPPVVDLEAQPADTLPEKKSDTPQQAQEPAKSVVQEAGDVARKAYDMAKNVVSGASEALTGGVSKALGGAERAAQTAAKDTGNPQGAVAEGTAHAAQGLPSTVQGAAEAVKSGAGAASQGVQQGYERAKLAGKDAVQSVRKFGADSHVTTGSVHTGSATAAAKKVGEKARQTAGAAAEAAGQATQAGEGGAQQKTGKSASGANPNGEDEVAGFAQLTGEISADGQPKPQGNAKNTSAPSPEHVTSG